MPLLNKERNDVVAENTTLDFEKTADRSDLSELSTTNVESLPWRPASKGQAARAYIAIGWKIFPCHWITKAGICSCYKGSACGKSAGKHPITTNGHKNASSDPAAVKAWWTDHPKANIGLPLDVNGLAAVDIDPRKGGNVTLAELEDKHGRLESILRATSGSGGEHIVYSFDPKANVPGQLGTGIDLKHHGYIIVEPSSHVSGGTYRWQSGRGPFDADYAVIGAPAKLPAWIATKAEKTLRDALSAAPQRVSLGRVESALKALPNGDQFDDREEWLKIGAAVHHATGGSSEGYDLFETWSADHDSFNHDHTIEAWNSFRRKDGKVVTVNTLFHLADKAGWVDTVSGAFGAVLDDEPEQYGLSELEVKRRLVVNVADVHGTAEKIVNTLQRRGVEIYRRGDRLVQVVLKELPKELHAREGVITAHLVPIDPRAFVLIASEHITFLVASGQDRTREIAPPRTITDAILETASRWSFPEVNAVVGSPILRPDGSILSERGYDALTKTFLTTTLTLPAMPDHPTRDDALAALELLSDLINEFPFVTEDGSSAHQSVALAAMISATTRGLYPVVPATILSAPAPGTGKSYLADLIALIATGQRCAAMAAGRDEAETEKRLDGAILRGLPIVAIDNLNGTIGGDKLCMIVERPVIDVRALGKSDMLQVPNSFTVLGNGNQIELSIDIARRCLLCQLDANEERPELRHFSKRPDVLISEERGRYVGACIIIVRAWQLAMGAGERPIRPALASFEVWSDIVRSALSWLGQADPVDTMAEGRSTDPNLDARRAIFPAWHALLGDKPHTVAEVLERAAAQALDVDQIEAGLMAAIKAHLPEQDRHGRDNDTRRLGILLRGSKGLVTGGLKLEGNKTNQGMKWSVRKPRAK